MTDEYRPIPLTEVIKQYGFHHRAHEADEQHRRLVLRGSGSTTTGTAAPGDGSP